MCEQCENINKLQEKSESARVPNLSRLISEIYCPLSKAPCQDNCAIFDGDNNQCGIMSFMDGATRDFFDFLETVKSIRQELKG